MRRFELVEGKSSKFWEVQVKGCDVTVRFGRIGANGTTQTKTFGDSAAATKERDKLVKEKTDKGYSEVAVATGAKLATPLAATPSPVPPVAAPTVVPAPAPTTKAPTAATPTAPVPTPAAMPAATAAPAAVTDAIDVPRGGFQWTPALQEVVPIARGIHAPPLPDGRELLALPIAFVKDRNGGHIAHMVAELGQACARSWTYWSPEQAADLITPERLESGEHDFWLELCGQAMFARLKQDEDDSYWSWYQSRGLQWVSRVGIALRGLAFMSEIALDLWRGSRQLRHAGHMIGTCVAQLRHAIAAASEAEHQAAIDVLERQSGATPSDRLLRACLCPHRTDWVQASIADGTDESYSLKETVLPADAALAYLKGMPAYFSSVQGPLLLQTRLQGEAAFPLFAHFLRKADDRDSVEKLTDLTMRMHVPELPDLLAELIERKESRAALDKLAERFPAAVLKAVIERALASRSRLAEGWAVRFAFREPSALASVLPALEAGERERFQGVLDELRSEEAPADALPPLLRQPPWLGKARAVELPMLDIAARTTPERVVWDSDERARFASYKSDWASRLPDAEVFKRMRVSAEGQIRVAAGQSLRPEDVVPDTRFYGERPDLVLRFPDQTGLALWNSYPTKHWYSWGRHDQAINAILARWDTRALKGFIAYLQSRPEEGLALALPVDSSQVVPSSLHALRNLKKARAPAVDWLRAHAATALTAALPVAFGKGKAERDDARFGVRWLCANGFHAQAREAAAAYGGEMPAALQALLNADPLLVLPSRMPKLPTFFVPASLRRPRLRESDLPLPTSAMEHLASMLAISKSDAPYAGIALVKESCTSASLAEFAWDLFEAWQGDGAPSKEGWALTALGLLGNDETARRLAPRIREWPGESQHPRAVTGLDLLAQIGSDVALMHLNGIAAKVKFKALQDRAKEKIAAVADARGFTAAELADRLVPDLGLDEQGTLELDFGPRQFFVSFDETLKPFVKDAQGTRLKDLPKPIKSDDTALAEAATDRFKQMKKDAKAVASLQVTRLELAMIDRRRWSGTDFRLFFLEHPLMRHLAARLMWGVYGPDGALAGAFRVAEDWTLADAQDSAYALPDGATVGIAHVLEVPKALQDAFGQVFADYEILQPFKQLGRETYALTDAEKKSNKITRYANKEVATGSVMGLVNRGWERGQAQDAGWVGWFSKAAGDGLQVDLELEPGTVIGDIGFEPKQTFPAITLRRAGTWDANGLVEFERLHPIEASEVLRDVELLAPLKDA
jgi:predicted DNA-binding WGR domain protein